MSVYLKGVGSGPARACDLGAVTCPLLTDCSPGEGDRVRNTAEVRVRPLEEEDLDEADRVFRLAFGHVPRGA